MRDGMNRVLVDFVSNLVSKMPNPVGHSLARKRAGLWREIRLRDRAHHDENKPFHLSSLLFMNQTAAHTAIFERTAVCARAWFD